MIEEHTHADGTRWGVSDIRAFPTREMALDAAETIASAYQPRHPMSKRSRRIMRTGGDVWIVLIEGITRSFHFRLSVARQEPS